MFVALLKWSLFHGAGRHTIAPLRSSHRNG